MLNESHMLLKALRENKIELPSYHPRIKSPGQSLKAVRVVLSYDGTVSSVSEMTKEEMGGLWTIREGNQNSFPVIRLAIPLNDLKGKDKDRQLMERLRDIKATELAALAGTSGDDQIELLIGFARAFMLASKDIDVLLRLVCDKITEAQKNGRFSVDLAKKIMSGQTEAALQFAFDMAANSIYQKDVRFALESALPFEIGLRLNNQVNNMRSCALSGKDDVLSSPFPSVPLPKQVLPKEFPIFSMYSLAKCNVRYGFQDHEIVPISRSETQDIAGALLWITDENRFGRTWRGIARGEYKKQGRKRSEKQDLLIVYVDGMPDIMAENANLFGTDQDSIVKQFEADAGTVCNALKGFAKQKPESKLNLFLIRDVSQGQAQVVLSETFSVDWFFRAVEQWQRAVKENLPAIEILLPSSQKGEKGVIAIPPVPYPDEIVKILSRKYISLGLDARDVRGVGFGDVLNFMIRKEGKWEDAYWNMLNLMMQNYEPLLIGLFGAKHSCDQERFQKYSSLARKDALRAISLLGLLLDANNRKKEIYMKDAAFKIGGFLALADILHKDYCIAVRNNSLPPSLIGNAMMPRTFDSPRLAINDLADRMRIYTGWAKTVKVPDDDEEKKIAVFEAKKTLVRYELLSKLLHEIGLPDQCNDGMKAEILLGYLASTKGIDIEINETEKEAKS